MNLLRENIAHPLIDEVVIHVSLLTINKGYWWRYPLSYINPPNPAVIGCGAHSPRPHCTATTGGPPASVCIELVSAQPFQEARDEGNHQQNTTSAKGWRYDNPMVMVCLLFYNGIEDRFRGTDWTARDLPLDESPPRFPIWGIPIAGSTRQDIGRGHKNTLENNYHNTLSKQIFQQYPG